MIKETGLSLAINKELKAKKYGYTFRIVCITYVDVTALARKTSYGTLYLKKELLWSAF